MLSMQLALFVFAPAQAEFYVGNPQGDAMVFASDHEVAGQLRLYRTPADPAGDMVELSGPMNASQDDVPIHFGADGRALHARFEGILKELFSIAPDGTRVRLDASARVGNVVVSQSGQHVLFTDNRRLYFRRVDGTDAAVELGVGTGASDYSHFRLSPDASVAAFIGEGALGWRLWIQPTDASAAPFTRLGFLVEETLFGASPEMANLEFSADGAYVLCRQHDLQTTPVFGVYRTVKSLHRVPVNGVDLPLELPDGALAPEGRSVISPGTDGSLLEIELVNGRRRVLVGAGKVHREEREPRGASFFKFTRDGLWILQIVHLSDGWEVRSAPRVGALRASVLLHGLSEFQALADDGTYLVYRHASQNVSLVRLDGTGVPLALGSGYARASGSWLAIEGTVVGQPISGLWSWHKTWTAPRLIEAHATPSAFPQAIVGDWVVCRNPDLVGAPLDASAGFATYID